MPQGGDLAFDPARTTTLYTATGDGVWKSANSGSTWRSASRGLPSGYISGIAVDPRYPTNLYAVVGVAPVPGHQYIPNGPAALYLSTDGAASWSPFAPRPRPELAEACPGS